MNWITDAQGMPVQYIHYAPYGELIANQTPYLYDERYVKIAPMYEDTFHQGLPMSVYDMKQAFIIMMATL